MTAEIAILNKSAVALAADSAVTISAGSSQEKIFNTAEKLFELSDNNPIGIMIYNEMSFMEAPLPLLIRKFRRECKTVDHAQDAATAFLRFLDNFGKTCGEEVKERHIVSLINPIIRKIFNEVGEAMRNLVFEDNVGPDDFKEKSYEAIDTIILDLENVLAAAQPAYFFDHGDFQISEKLKDKIRDMVNASLEGLEPAFRSRIENILQSVLMGDILSPGLTGIVIAGFGSRDMFPTLISFEIDGMVCGSLKHVKTNFVDIDRNTDPGTNKDKAKILPFAQREMVDRFLYGLDNGAQRAIAKFARTAISDIRKKLSDKYTFENGDDARIFAKDMEELENVLVNSLVGQAFASIKDVSRSEIEDIVEFMPKPELAHMAEALVELTSIKRRVSRGMETVGGPIDVAIISQTEGFVWIKRKHYFPMDLNSRYTARLNAKTNHRQEEIGNGEKP